LRTGSSGPFESACFCFLGETKTQNFYLTSFSFEFISLHKTFETRSKSDPCSRAHDILPEGLLDSVSSKEPVSNYG